MRESVVENYLVKRMKAIGGKALKVNSLSMNGLPDRLCIFPDGQAIWIELKAPGKKPTKLQQKAIKWLRSMGQRAYVIDSRPRVDAMIKIVAEAKYE